MNMPRVLRRFALTVWVGLVGCSTALPEHHDSSASHLLGNALFHIKATDMMKTTGGQSDTGGLVAWNLWSDGSVYTDLSIPDGSVRTLQIRAYGQSAGGVDPTMNVLVDGVAVRSFAVVSGSWNDYSFDVSIAAGARRISLAYTNDAIVDGIDRNLLVYDLAVGNGLDSATSKTFRIVPRLDERFCTDISTRASGGRLYIWQCSENNPNQMFEFLPSGEIKLAGKCLSARAGYSSGPLTIEDCDGAANQAFSYDSTRGLLRTVDNLCVDVFAGRMTNNTFLNVYTCDAANRNQQFQVVATTGARPPSSNPGGGPGYPFASHRTPYVAGIRPTVASQAAQDALVGTQYDYWKSQIQARCGGYIVRFSDSSATVSEGAGYGMLLAAVMAGHDSDARSLFDGLFRVVRSHPAYGLGEPALMEWKIRDDCSSDGGGWNAVDGDLDIAMALLMADRQWGSSGAVNYRAEALATIDAMKRRNFRSDGTTMGGGVSHLSRTSDYMITHFKAFKRATGDSFWDMVADRSFALLNHSQNNLAPVTGLIPDFLIYTDSSYPQADNLHIGDDSPNSDAYYWNGCRIPWRLASDYVTSGDERSKNVTSKLMNFFNNAAGGRPERIQGGYRLDGTGLSSVPYASFIGPAMAGAMVDNKFQPFLNSLWSYSSSNLARGYYDTELQLLSLIVASGNWWNP